MLQHKLFIEKVQNLFSRGIKPNCTFLFYIDINNFHVINHQYGIEKGNTILRDLEKYIASFGFVPVCERVFSDQFVFIVNPAKPVSKETINVEYEKAITRFIAAEKDKLPYFALQFSCGYSNLVSDKIEEIIEFANLARKYAKKNDLHYPVIFQDEILKQIFEGQNFIADLNFALQKDQFVFYLQPKVNIVTGQITGAEALARLQGSDGKIYYPESFISIMEQNNMIVQLDYLILEKVCKFLAHRLETKLPVVCTSVNLSRMHMKNPDTAQNIHSIVEEYKIPSYLLEFEISESILIEEFTSTQKIMKEIGSYGYRLSIDNFGSGYNCISILQYLDFNAIKLDKFFLSDEETIRSKNAAILPNVINIAQRLNIEVICKGVETVEQCQYLFNLGCSAVQGFYFSQAVAPETFYENYTELNGTYNIRNKKKKSLFNSDALSEKSRDKKHGVLNHLLLFLSMTTVITVSIISAVLFNKTATAEVFLQSVNSNFDTYMTANVQFTNNEIISIENTLKAYSELIKNEDSIEAILPYITALNNIHTPPPNILVYEYADEEKLVNSGTIPGSDEKVIDVLKRGETIVTDIYTSAAHNGTRCLAIGVPIYIHGDFAGCIRAIVDAAFLLNTDRSSPYGFADRTLIADEEGVILLSSHLPDLNKNLSEILATEDESAVQKVLNGILGDDNDVFISENRGNYYLISADLEYNNWHFITFFNAVELKAIENDIRMNTFKFSAILVSGIILAGVAFCIYIYLLRKDINGEAKKYALLTNFTDTVLFEYHPRNDVISFTPNYTSIFNADDINMNDYVKSIYNSRHTYYSDISTVEEMLLGKIDSEPHEIRCRIRNSSNDYRWTKINFIYNYGKNNKLTSVIGKIVDIDDNYRHEKDLVERSIRDSLTGLYNYGGMVDLVNKSIDGKNPGTMLFFDIDDFKKINDKYGHDYANNVLHDLAATMHQCFDEKQSICARIGGDELIVYIAEPCSISDIQKLLNNFIASIGKNKIIGSAGTTLSVGIARFPEDGKTLDEIIHYSDQSMYMAKKSGKNKYCIGNKTYTFEK